MNKIIKVILGVVVVLGMLSTAVAITDPSGAATSVGATGQFTGTSAGNATAQGGNVTNLNVSSNASTTKWQGFYGNVSGGLRLGSGTDVFYDFGSSSFTTIFAASATDVNWATLAPTTAAEIDTQWSFNTASDVDQAVDIYTGTNTFASVGAVPSLTLHTNFGSGIMEDGDDVDKGDYVFVANVTSAGAVGFAGDTYQFEMMVPVEAGTEVYNFYLSLE